MIKHLVMDVDGVLNTGQVLYSDAGKMFKIFGPHDRDGVKLAQSLGVTIDFITADYTGWKITYARIVLDWGFSPKNLHLVTEEDRLTWMENKFNLNEVAFIGDGIHDVPVLSKAGLSIAPISARKEAKEVAMHITEHAAGNGAVLDACLILEKVLKLK